MQQRFDTRKYSIRDFEEWDDKGDLILVPKFQRRDVWNPKARSYLIDTILRGKPIPKIYMRVQVNTKTRQAMREVVDGQQRLRSVLNFLKDGFKVSKVHNEDHGGKCFSELGEDAQHDVLKYEFTVDLLQDMQDDEVYEVFARLNTYASTLNAQELRHAKWFGDFRTSVYTLAKEFVTFWESSKVFSSKQILRMAEAEFVSELLIAMSEGVRAKEKRLIDKFYKNNDDVFPNRKGLEKRFRETLDHIGGIMAGALSESHFKATRLLYPLFCAVYHMQFGLPGMNLDRISFKRPSYPKVKSELEQVDELLERLKEDRTHLDSLSPEQRKFYRAYGEHWVHAEERKNLTQYLCKLILKALPR